MYMAEMRTVTTLFVKLDSYSPEKNKNLLSLQVRFLQIQQSIPVHDMAPGTALAVQVVVG